MINRTRYIPARVWILLGVLLGAAVAAALSASALSRGSAGETGLGIINDRNAETAEILRTMGR